MQGTYVTDGYNTGNPQIINSLAYFDPDDNGVSFLDRGWTEAQFTDFRANYRVVYHQPNQANGFSATLFQNIQSGKHTVAFRGTEGAMDLIQDVALTTGASTFLPYSQENSIGQFLQDAGIFDDQGAIKAEFIGNVDFTGHSLGGYLSIWAGYKYQDLFDQVYTFNGAGISRVGPVGLINELRAATVLDPSREERFHNIYGDELFEVVANKFTFFRPGEYAGLFIENRPLSGIGNHSMSLLVESLSVYRLFSALDDSLSTETVTAILNASDNQSTNSLASAVTHLSNLLGDDFSYASQADAQQFYEDIGALQLSSDASTGIAPLQLRLAAVEKEIDQGKALAKEAASGLSGNAWRFALDTLSPFVVVAGIEATEAANSCYDHDPGRFSDAWVDDRSLMLAAVLERNSQDSVNAEAFGDQTIVFQDVRSKDDFIAGQYGLKEQITDGAQTRHIVFGGDADDTLVGSGVDDRIYGGEGNDLLIGLDGGDYLEGGGGDDILEGGAGNNTLVGGLGSDTYVFEESSEWQGDVTISGDMAEDVIQYNGRTLNAANAFRLGPGSNIYRDVADGTLYVHMPEQSRLWINFNRTSSIGGELDSIVNTGNILVTGYSIGNDLGIALTAPAPDYPAGGIVVDEGMPDSGERIHAIFDTRQQDVSQATVNQQSLTYDAEKYYPLPGPEQTLGPHTYRFEGGNNDDKLAGGNWDTSLFDPRYSIAMGNSQELFGDWINGKDGDDYLSASGGDDGALAGDLLIGGRGSDLVFGGSGADLLFGQDEYKLSGAEYDAALDGLLENANDSDTLFGGAGDDIINGGSYNDMLSGDAGADTLLAGAGDDRVSGGTEDDFIFGDSFNRTGFVANDLEAWDIGPGFISNDDSRFGAVQRFQQHLSYDDVLRGEGGDDALDGEIGDDEIYGGAGNDRIQGDRLNSADYFTGLKAGYHALAPELHGNDRLHGGYGDDRIDGNAGNDTLHGDAGDDLLRGDDNILLELWHGDDFLDGGAGRDYIEGNGGHDTLLGGDGDDVLWGDRHYDAHGGGILNPFAENRHLSFAFHGDDTVNAGSGDDTIDAGGGADLVFGGSGADTIYSDGGEDTIVLPSGTHTSYHIDADFHGDDTVFGGEGGDFLSAGWGDDLLYGGGGPDILRAGPGQDTLHGDAGDDTLRGGSGYDTYVFGTRAGVDLIEDDGGLVKLIGSSASSALLQQANGISALSFGQDSRIFVATEHFKNFTFENESGFLDVMLNAGTEGADILHFSAGSGDVYAGGGDDTVMGGAGSDTINGGAGNDTLTGGAGRDLFRFDLDGGLDTIDSFDDGAGKLDRIRFTSGIDPAGTLLARDGDDLRVLVNALSATPSSDEIRVTNHFVSAAHRINAIEFDDSTHWNDDFIRGNAAVFGTGYADTLNGSGDADRLYGLGGNDRIYANAGDDVLGGGAGNDILFGGTGNDTYEYYRGDGNDTLVNIGDGDLESDSLRLHGFETSELAFSKQYGDLIIHLGDTGEYIKLQNNFSDQFGSCRLRFIVLDEQTLDKEDIYTSLYALSNDSNNILYDSATDSILDAQAGHDTIYGRGGNDLLLGGSGSDTLLGGDGADTYFYTRDDLGHDRIVAETGQDSTGDVIRFGAGISPEQLHITDLGLILHGASSRIVIDGSMSSVPLRIEFEDSPSLSLALAQPTTTDTVDCGEYHASIGEDTSLLSNDSVLRRSAAFSSVLYGSAGSDRIIDPFDRGASYIALGPGDDLFVGGHTVARSGDSQRPIQGAVKTWLNGIELGSGNDTAFSGGSSDIITYGGTYTYDQYDALEQYGSYIHLDGDNRIHTEGGNDTIANYSGNDYFDPGFGDDMLYSGGGDDTIYFGRGYGSDQLDGPAWFYDFKASDLRPGDDNGNTTLVLGEQISGSDLVLWSHNQDLVVAIENTRDRFTVRNYSDGLEAGNSALETILFSDGSRWNSADIVAAMLVEAPAYTPLEQSKADHLVGTAGGDILQAGGLNHLVSGEDGDDGLYGSNVGDTLAGGNGNDQLEGGEGDDELVGGAGNDYLIGGNDSDTYRFEAGFGNDIINNYDDTVGESLLGGESTDTALFGAGLRPQDLTFSRTADDLVMSSDQGSVTVSNHFRGQGYGFNSRYALDRVQFAGGETLDREQFEALVGTAVEPDTVVIEGGSRRDIIEGSAEPEHIIGHGGHDSLYGGAGDDTLVGGPGNDRIEAGSGNDVVLIQGFEDGFDTVSGGEGVDTILGSAGDDTLGLGTFNPASSVELIDGLAGSNVLAGQGSRTVWDFQATELRNIAQLEPGAGHDTVVGSAATDTLLGATGNDRLSGAGGDDVFLVSGSGHGFDTLFGGEGYDSVLGSEGDDVFGLASLSPESSIELIDGGLGSNYLQGTGSRTVWDFSATELRHIAFIDGGSGHDSITGSAAADTLVGGKGNDRIVGGGGDDVFIVAGKNEGIDSLFGSTGSDTLLGSAGDDDFGLGNLNAASSLELIDGGAGINRIMGSGSRTIWDFSATELRNIDSLDAGAGHDTIIGSAQDDLIIGGRGNDKLRGGPGEDTYQLYRGHGHDTILGDGQDSAGDLLLFSGVLKEELWFSRRQDDLLVTLVDDQDSVTIEDWYQQGPPAVGQIATDSDVLLAGQVQLLVDAMAAFEPESFAAIGDRQLQDQPQLQAALAAAWRPVAGQS